MRCGATVMVALCTAALTTCVGPALGAASRPSHARSVVTRLTLADAVALALRNHPAGLAARSRVTAAQERVGEARSRLLPQVNAVGEYLRATDNGIGDATYVPFAGIARVPSQGRHDDQLTDTFDNYLGGVSVYQYLFDFGRTRGLVMQRDAEADASRARLASVQIDLVFQVSQAYYGLRAAKEIVHVFEDAVKQRAQHLQAAQAKSNAGLRPAIDAYTAEAELARANLRLVDARNEEATEKATLDNAMGAGEAPSEYELGDVLDYSPVPGSLDEYVRRALAQRPDIKFLEDEARAAGAEVEQYRSDYLPAIGAVAGYDVRGNEGRAANNFHAGLVVTWPLFNGFLTDHQVAEARAKEETIGHTIADLRQQVVLQVQRAYLDWQSSVERIHRAEQSLEASQVELDLAQQRYASGLGSIIELTDAQRQLTEDRAARVRALADFSIAEAAVARSTGTPVPQP